jgi:hypothetical protein
MPQQASAPAAQVIPGTAPTARPNLPPGFEMGEGGVAQPIPGTPQATEMQQKEEAIQRRKLSETQAIQSARALLTHPGRKAATGLTAPSGYVPASPAYDFKAALQSFKSETFIPQVLQLVGLGALSDAEGDKLIAAVGALDPNMSEAAFEASLNDIIRRLESKRDVMQQGGAQGGEIKNKYQSLGLE